MTKKALSKFAGETIFALCVRSGGRWATIYRLCVYEITKRGTLVFQREVFPLIANKVQYAQLDALTEGNYVAGRPTAEEISADKIEALVAA